MRVTFFDRLQQFPPCLVRLLARHKHGPPITDEEISAQSGISLYRIQLISQLTNWLNVDVATVHAFTRACGVDLHNRDCVHRKLVYLNVNGTVKRNGKRLSPKFTYLKKSKEWKTLYRPLIQRWISAMQ